VLCIWLILLSSVTHIAGIQPRDYVKGKHRGFCFVEFEDPEDAEEAVFNMDGAEILGRFIKVSLAQPNQVNKLSSGGGGKEEAIWKSDEWFQQYSGGGVDEATREKHAVRLADVETLKEL
jgi:peptidyl-prolyl isomerase E (cyclophilin E)